MATSADVNILAMPKDQELVDPTKPFTWDNYLGGDNLESRTAMAAAAQAAGVYFIPGYASLGDLVARVQQIVVTHAWTSAAGGSHVGGVLTFLEVHAHGAPFVVDAVNNGSLAAFVAGLKATNLADRVDLYLSGCNTAVCDNQGPSIAQRISAAGPTVAADNVQLTVWGTVGYNAGTRTQRNNKCTDSCTTKHGKVKMHHAPYPPSIAQKPGGTPVYPGSRNESDPNKCFIGFREGNPL